MKIHTTIKAGGLELNHNQTVRGAAQPNAK